MQMLQADIDLLQQEGKDSYFFALRLISLTKNKKKPLKHVKNSHFKFVLQQNDYIFDQTHSPIQNIFWMIKTTMISLNKELLHFSVPDITQSKTQFELKLYMISHQQVKQLAEMNIQTLTYVEVFLECGKGVFRETVSVCSEYTLEYEIYVQRSEIDLSNLVRDGDEEMVGMKNAFKKKRYEVIEIENEKVEIKPKRRDMEEKNVLRKSLYVNVNKLMEIKKRNQEIKDKSMSKNGSKSSFFSQIGDIFRSSKPSQTLQSQQLTPSYTQSLINASRTLSQQRKKQKTDSQRSFSIHPPWIDRSRVSRDSTVSQEDSLKILRQKQRIRMEMSGNGQGMKVGRMEKQWKIYVRVFRVVVVILVVAFFMYFFTSGGKRGRYNRWWKSLERLVNVK